MFEAITGRPSGRARLNAASTDLGLTGGQGSPAEQERQRRKKLYSAAQGQSRNALSAAASTLLNNNGNQF